MGYYGLLSSLALANNKEKWRKISENKGSCIFEQKTGDGKVECFKVLHGVELLNCNVKMENSDWQNQNLDNSIIGIGYSLGGRVECEYSKGICSFLSTGDLSVRLLGEKSSKTWFPLSYYSGIYIVINIKECQKEIIELSKMLFGFSIEFDVLVERLNKYGFMIFIKESFIEQSFKSLNQVSGKHKIGYYRLKIMELLLFLSTCEYFPNDEKVYIYKNQVETIKEIHTFLIENIDKRFTMSEISKKFQISLTSMKKISVLFMELQ